MSLRDRIARTLWDRHPRVAKMLPEDMREWDVAPETHRIWFRAKADAILSDPEIAALREVAEAVIEEVAAESSFEPTAGHRDRRGVARRIATAKSRKYAALARLEEARRG